VKQNRKSLASLYVQLAIEKNIRGWRRAMFIWIGVCIGQLGAVIFEELTLKGGAWKGSWLMLGADLPVVAYAVIKFFHWWKRGREYRLNESTGSAAPADKKQTNPHLN
jgi:hypothetical protein